MAVIPARGGSKRIRRKALVRIRGAVELISRTVRQALDLKRKGWLDAVVVSTEDARIRAVASGVGRGQLELINRPRALATDKASSLAVIRHAVKVLRERDLRVKTVVLLQVTSPLRRDEDVVRALQRFARGDADAVVSVSGTHPPPEWMYRVRGGCLGRRVAHGARKASVALNGAVYVAGARHLARRGFTDGRCAFVRMPWGLSVDIDEPADLELARVILKDGRLRRRLERSR